jgi:hypothetical protein
MSVDDLLAKADSRLTAAAFALRSAADYETPPVSQETAEETLGNARSFVAACRSLISRS